MCIRGRAAHKSDDECNGHKHPSDCYHNGASNGGCGAQGIADGASRPGTTTLRPNWREAMMARWWPTKLWRHVDEPAHEPETMPMRAVFLGRLYRLALLDARRDLDAEQRSLVNHA